MHESCHVADCLEEHLKRKRLLRRLRALLSSLKSAYRDATAAAAALLTLAILEHGILCRCLLHLPT